MATDPAAVQLADTLADMIRGAGLRAGALVASEQDLRARHEVGRSVLRQAARILEARGVAFMKRGIGGGLIVAPPDPEPAGRALAILLESRMQGPYAADRLLKAVDTHVFLTSTPRLDPDECDQVRQLARRLKRDELTGDIPIIMLTAKGEEDNKIQGLEVGADDYITKPFSAAERYSRPREGPSGRPRLPDNRRVRAGHGAL